MVTSLEYEMKTGTMLRGITSDIKRRYRAVIKNLYDPKYEGPGDYAKSAEDWHNIISDFCSESDNAFDTYLISIELAMDAKHDLWKDKRWKRLMRVDLPQQFRKRMNEFTQVPKLSAIDEVREKIEDKPREWCQ